MFISTLFKLVYSFESLLIKLMQGSGVIHFIMLATNDFFNSEVDFIVVKGLKMRT